MNIVPTLFTSDKTKLTISSRELTQTNYKPQFPYKVLDSTDNFSIPQEIMAQKVKYVYLIDQVSHDSAKMYKFCAMCDFPMIIRIRMVPCEHYTCYSCLINQNLKECPV